MKTLIKRTYRLLIILANRDLRGFFKYHDKKANHVVWIFPNGIDYIFTASIIWDAATIRSLILQRKRFRIVIGKRIGAVRNSCIYYTLHSRYNVFGFGNYVNVFDHVLQQLIAQGNKILPAYNEAKMWENKAHMHQEFERHEVPCPATIITNASGLDFEKISFHAEPFLIKEVHSFESKGLHTIRSKAELEAVKQALIMQTGENSEVLVQRILDMRRDIRVIIVNGEIVHHYWRINLSESWRPTATSKGNKVDFQNFPEHHRAAIISYAERLGLSSCGFDIAWDHDDLSGQPLVLEVSPVYSPNPITDKETDLLQYGAYKKKLALRGYDFRYVKTIFDIKHKHLSKNSNVASFIS